MKKDNDSMNSLTYAFHVLQQSHLEACYREANQELEDAFEITALDGIEDNETW